MAYEAQTRAAVQAMIQHSAALIEQDDVAQRAAEYAKIQVETHNLGCKTVPDAVGCNGN